MVAELRYLRPPEFNINCPFKEVGEGVHGGMFARRAPGALLFY